VKFMKNKKIGFTLIELLVVISIIGILMGLLVSQLGGILGSSENTKMQAVMRSWVIQLNEYKNYYGYYPPFLYQSSEGSPIMLNDPVDNQGRFFYSLKGKEKTESGWNDGDSYEIENKDKKEFHSFSEDEFDADGNLLGINSLRILVDHDRDGMIEMESDVVDDILNSLSPDYDKEEMNLIRSRIDQFSVINEEIAFYILNDNSGVSNVFSWNIDKYFE
jgi:prepilin-type N-terminal cleavage/methylation domain-containing protein